MNDLQKILKRNNMLSYSLIRSTIEMLKLSSKHSGVDLSDMIKDWEIILEELNDAQQKGDEQ